MAQMDHFRVEQVNEAQGFLFARPLEPELLEAQLLAPTRPTGEKNDQVSRSRASHARAGPGVRPRASGPRSTPT